VQDYKSSNHKSNLFEPHWLTHAHIDTGAVNKDLTCKAMAKAKDLTFKAQVPPDLQGQTKDLRGKATRLELMLLIGLF